MSKPIIGAIDGDKVVSWAETEHSRKKGEDGFSVGYRTAMSWIINRVESGTFPLSDQSEATRLREALQRVRVHLVAGMSEFSAEEARYIVDEALSSSHREDGKRIGMTHNDRFQLACLVKEYGAETIIGLIPGITEER
jgi:hypothetical protein